MTIQKSDFTVPEQDLIQQWIDDDIPARIAAYQTTVTALETSETLIEGIDDIFEKIYESWTELHNDGFLDEIKALGTDPGSDTSGNNTFDPITDAAEVLSIAQNPIGKIFFPSTSIDVDPAQVHDLNAQPGDFNDDAAAWTGIEGTGGFAATGYDEREALVREDDEWNEGISKDDNIIRDMWLSQEAALQNQITSLTLLDNNLSVGQGGKANLALALSLANARLTTIQGYITAFPALPGDVARQAEIVVSLDEIDARVDQIIPNDPSPTPGVPGTDQNFVRDERYFWFRMRLNLAFGSLARLESTRRAIDIIEDRIADLQTELTKYTAMGF